MGVVDIAARRYAVALLDVAGEKGLADRCLSDLAEFQRQVERTPELSGLVHDPSMAREVTTRAAVGVARAMRLHDMTVAFLGVLASRRRLDRLPAILAASAEELDRRAGRARGELVSAGPIAPAQLGRIREAIGKSLGKSLVLTQRVDRSLVGGVQVTVGDRVYDMSVRTYLESLRSHLLEIR